MNKLLAFTILLFLAVSSSVRGVLVNLSVDLLSDAAGTPIPEGSGLFLVVISTGDSTFGLPTPGSFVSGDDVIIARSPLSSGTGFPGCFFFDPSFTIGTNSISQDDPIGLFFFPTLNMSSTSPQFGTSYGFVRDTNALSGGDFWVVPQNNNATIALNFYTVDATNALGPGQMGPYPAFDGRAHYIVVPEVMMTMPLVSVAAAFVILRRSRRG